MMITTFLQYRIVYDALKMFRHQLQKAEEIEKVIAPDSYMPELRQASLEAMRQQVNSLEQELADFEQCHPEKTSP